MAATTATLLTRLRHNGNPACSETGMHGCAATSQPVFPLAFQMSVSRLRPAQTGRNTPQIARRSLLPAPQTVRDRTDEARIVPPAGLPAHDAFVALRSGTTTNRSTHKYFALPRRGHDGSEHSLHRKTYALLTCVALVGIYPMFATSNRSPLGKL